MSNDGDAGDCCPDCKKDVEDGREEIVRRASVTASGGKVIKAIPWRIKFACEGKKGDVVNVQVPSPCIFRGEELIAGDTAVQPGCGTQIRQIKMGGKLQRPPGVGPSLTKLWFKNPLGCGVRFDTVNAGQICEIEVEFLEDCAWSATLDGRAVK